MFYLLVKDYFKQKRENDNFFCYYNNIIFLFMFFLLTVFFIFEFDIRGLVGNEEKFL